MKKLKIILLMVLSLSIFFLLNACSTAVEEGLPAEDVQATQQTIPVLPTQLSGKVLSNTSSPSCLLDSLVPIQVKSDQGDLVSWSPVSDTLAFVQPTNQVWGWYVGAIVIFTPENRTTETITKDQPVYGDLTWAPDGNSIAYIVFDQTSGAYTVKIIDLPGMNSTDVFSGSISPQTDSWSSRKGIQGWTDLGNLAVRSSCGSDCVREFDFNIDSAALKVTGEIRKSEDTSLQPQNENTSPDGKWTITVDDNDNTWISSNQGNQVSLLLAETTINEIKWSVSSKYFALRTQDRIQIYETNCSQN